MNKQFCCKSDPSYCIDWWHVCDNVYDCFDRSDEMDCPSMFNMRNRTKKDDIAANKLAKLIGLLNVKKKNSHTHTHTQNTIPSSLFLSLFIKNNNYCQMHYYYYYNPLF